MGFRYAFLFFLLLLPLALSVTYIPNEEGQFVITVTDIFGNPVPVSTCYATIFYPNKTVFLNQTMTPTGYGTFYVNFTVPRVYGIYEERAVCYVTTNLGVRRLSRYSAFKVSTIDSVLHDFETRLNQTLSNLQDYLGNISINATVNATVNLTSQLTEVPDDVWERYVQLLPYLNKIEKLSNHNYCKDNITLVHNITYYYELPDGRNGTVSYLQEEKCEWGCNPELAKCNPNPLIRYGIGIGLIVALSFIIWIFIP